MAMGSVIETLVSAKILIILFLTARWVRLILVLSIILINCSNLPIWKCLG
jgi:hypothetical protein